MWKRVLASIFGIIGLVLWKRFLGEGSGVQSTAQDNPAEVLHKTWVKSGSMSGREFEDFMAELLRTAGYKVDVVGGAGDQGVDLLMKKGSKLIAVQCKKYGRPVGAVSMPLDPDTTTPPKPGDKDRDASGKIPLRAPEIPPSCVPAGLAVGFGPKELSPTPAREA